MLKYNNCELILVPEVKLYSLEKQKTHDCMTSTDNKLTLFGKTFSFTRTLSLKSYSCDYITMIYSVCLCNVLNDLAYLFYLLLLVAGTAHKERQGRENGKTAL